MPRGYVYIFGRIALFIIYGWFGALKVLGHSPASPLVTSLLAKTLPTIPPAQFILFLGIFEVIVGIMFLLPQFYKVTVTLFLIHMAMTIAPLFLLPALIWKNSFIPTLEGQYIIKNLALISIVWFLASDRR